MFFFYFIIYRSQKIMCKKIKKIDSSQLTRKQNIKKNLKNQFFNEHFSKTWTKKK